MVKEAEHSHSSHDNSCGITSVVFGILSIFFAYPPLYGVILGIITVIFGYKQQKYSPNKWGRRGIILGVIGVILSIIIYAFLLWVRLYYPQVFSQLNSGITPVA